MLKLNKQLKHTSRRKTDDDAHSFHEETFSSHRFPSGRIPANQLFFAAEYFRVSSQIGSVYLCKLFCLMHVIAIYRMFSLLCVRP